MALKVRSRKAKGRDLQKWVAKKIGEFTGLKFGKDSHIESRPMGQSGTDIRLSQSALELFPFSVECKRQEKLNIPAWIKQAKDNQIPGTDWLLIIRRSDELPFVVMSANRFFDILKHGLTYDKD